MNWIGIPWVAYSIGFAYSIVIGSACMHVFTLTVRSSRREALGKEHEHHPILIGLIERPLYTASYLLGHVEFVGLWLVLKTAVKWPTWAEGKAGREGKFYHYDFLGATALSLAFGVMGGIVGKLLVGSVQYPDKLLEAVYGATALALYSLILTGWLWLRSRSAKNAPTDVTESTPPQSQ